MPRVDLRGITLHYETYGHGAHDEHTPVSEMEELARRMPNARLSVYAEGGHSVHDGRSTRKDCTQAAQRFLRTVF